MGLKEIKKMKADKGFTIVELLIVIVVIGILAAIVIVAYQGVTSRANTSKAQTNAVSVQKKVEAFNADSANGNGQYPLTAAGAGATAYVNGTGIAVPVTGVTVAGGTGATVGAPGTAPTNITAAVATSTVAYNSCTVGGQVVGYYITYWDSTNSSKAYIVGGTTVVAGGTIYTVPTTTGCTLSTT